MYPGKRLHDLLFAIVGLMASIPLSLLVALINQMIFGKVFFIQTRMGKNSIPFQMIKFRSMTNDGRIPFWGKLMRRLSIDEIPQLINVIKGEMSVVGPRPLPLYYKQWLTSQEHQRHQVNPGITGLGQVNGRNDLSWEEKFQYDLMYLANCTFTNDLKILVRTPLGILSSWNQPPAQALNQTREPFTTS